MKQEPFEYIKQRYKVNPEIGKDVVINGKKGIIASDMGNYIGVVMEGTDHIAPAHPTWEVQYLDTFSKVPKETNKHFSSQGKKNYRDYMDEDPGISFIEWLKWRSKQSKAT